MRRVNNAQVKLFSLIQSHSSYKTNGILNKDTFRSGVESTRLLPSEKNSLTFKQGPLLDPLVYARRRKKGKDERTLFTLRSKKRKTFPTGKLRVTISPNF